MILIASDVPAEKPVVGNLAYETMDLGGQVAVGDISVEYISIEYIYSGK